VSGADEREVPKESTEALASALAERRRRRAAAGRSDERRTHDRFACRFDAAVTGPDGQRIAGHTRDLSLGGLFIECTHALALGTEVDTYLALPTNPKGITVRGTVRWTTRDGVGLQLGLLGARDTHAILATLKMLATAEDAGELEPEPA
jgi:type IV pilus assembly protein PilZ